jgi:hypothetical protein
MLNAHSDEVPFVLPPIGAGHAWVRVIDTIDAQPPELRLDGSTRYPLQGRSVALFRLDGERRQRRATDSGQAAVKRHTQESLAPVASER